MGRTLTKKKVARSRPKAQTRQKNPCQIPVSRGGFRATFEPGQNLSYFSNSRLSVAQKFLSKKRPDRGIKNMPKTLTKLGQVGLILITSNLKQLSTSSDFNVGIFIQVFVEVIKISPIRLWAGLGNVFSAPSRARPNFLSKISSHGNLVLEKQAKFWPGPKIPLGLARNIRL